MLAARRIFAGAISGTGHPVNDLKLMEVNAGKLSQIAALLEEYTLKLDRIPLPRFEQIIDCAVKGTPIV